MKKNCISLPDGYSEPNFFARSIRLLLLTIMLIASFITSNVVAQVSITAPTLYDTATCVFPTPYVTLGDIVIRETSTGDFGTGSNINLRLTVPTNFQFQSGAGSVSVNVGNMTGLSVHVTATVITVTFTVSATNVLDTLSISGIQVRGINVPNGPFNLVRGSGGGGGTAVINNDIAGTIHANFTSVARNSVILAQPLPTAVCEGGIAVFYITATHSPSYQWQENQGGGFVNLVDGGAYSNVHAASLIISGAPAAMTGFQYKCIVTGVQDVCTSVVAPLTVNPPPAITADPRDTAICEGTDGSFSVTAVGAIATYQWQRSTDNGITFSPFAIVPPYSVSGNSLLITAAPFAFNGHQYNCIVDDAVLDPPGCGPPATSLPGLLTVNPKPTMTSTNVATICSAGTANIPLTSNIPSTYTWIAAENLNTAGEDTTLQTGSPLIDTITNSTSTQQKVLYTVTPTSVLGSCIGNLQTDTVKVNPKPVVTDQTAITCSGTAFTVTLVDVTDGTVPAGTTYTWTNPLVTGSMTGGSAQATPQASISQTLNNPTSIAQTATYTVTPLSGGCAGPTFTVTVTVDTKPSITAQTPASCSGIAFTVSPVDVTDGIVPTGTTYTWTAPSVSGGVTGGSAQPAAQASISQTLTNPTNSVQTAFYSVTPAVGNCPGSAFTITVTVNPIPSLTNQTRTVCSGTAFSVTPVDITDGIVPAGTTYTWTMPVVTGGLTGGSAQAVAQASISQTLTNPTNAVQTATYTVTSTITGCQGATFTITVTVNPKASITNQTPAICSGAAFSFTPVNVTDGIVPAGTTYTWTAPVVTGGLTGGSAQGSAQASIGQTLTNPTSTAQTATYTVTPASGSCPGAAFTITVTVNAKPAVTNQTKITCSEIAFSFTPVDVTDGVIPSGTTYTWVAPLVTGGLTGASAQATAQASVSQMLTNPTNTSQTATYTVTPLAGTCPGSAFTATITVSPKPAITNQTPTPICNGIAFTVTPVNGTDGIVPTGTTYTWTAPVVTGGIAGGSAQSSAQTSVSQTFTNPTASAQTATYTVTPLAGSCAGSTFTITVTVNPQPSIINQTPAAICSGNAFTVTPVNVADGIVPPSTTYTWTVPIVAGGITGGSAQPAAQTAISQTLTNPTTSAQTATYTVTPLAGSCTGSTFTITVTVNATPAVTNQTATICSQTAFLVAPLDVTDGIVPAGTTFSWLAPAVTGGITGGSAQVAQASISQTLTNPTSTARTATYTVIPAVGTCAGSPFTVIVTVNPLPAVTGQTPAPICSETAFTVTPADGTDGIVPSGTTYTWSAPAVTGGLTGGSAQGSAQASISQTLTNPTNSAQTATYTVTPLSGNCSGATFTITVTVNPKPAIAAQTPAAICTGTAFTVTPGNITDGVVPAGTTYTWSTPLVTGGITGGSAQGSAQPSIAQTLTNPTNTAQTATYTVTPLSGSCAGPTFTITVTVNTTPAITNQTPATCSGIDFTVTPVNGTDGIVPSGTTYTWTAPAITGGVTGGSAQPLAQASVSQTLFNPTNTAQTATYTVTPVVGSCPIATYTVTVTVNPKPNVLTNNPSAVCAPLTVDLSLPSVTSGSTSGLTYTYFTDAGASVPFSTPTTAGPATYYIVGQTSTGCVDTTAVTVSVNPKPVLVITDPSAVCSPDTVNLTLPAITAGSTAGLTFSYFTDAGATNPMLDSTNVQVGGTYYIVGVFSATGCSDTAAVIASVDETAAGGSVGPDAFVCNGANGDTLTLTGHVGAVQKWQYSVNGGGTWTDIANTTAQLIYSNITTTTWYRARIIAFCADALSIEARITVDASPMPIGGTVSPNDTVCSGLNSGTLTLSGHSGNVVRWESSIDGGSTWVYINDTTVNHVYNNITTTTIYHAVLQYSSCNTATSSNDTITVTPASAAGTISGAVSGCAYVNGATLTLTAYTGNVVGWQYSVDQGDTWIDSVNTTSTFAYAGLTDTVFYRAIVNSGVCSNDTSAAVEINIYPKPIAMLTADTACLGGVTTFVNTSTVGSGFIQFNQWDFADNSSSTSLDPTHTYALSGTNTVSLTTTTNFGCLDTANATVFVYGLPDAQIIASGAISFCCGGSVSLSGIAGVNYSWSTSATTQSIVVNNCSASGVYDLTVKDPATQCNNSSSVSVVIFPGLVADAGVDNTISLGDSYILTGQGGTAYSWAPAAGLSNPGISNPVATPVITTTYVLTVSDINGCADIDSLTVTVIIDFNLDVSNLMTANGDGYNDKWIVQNIENYPGTEVIVVNREGQQIFYSSSYDNSWTGLNKNGNPLPDGTYYYFVKFRNSDKIYKGPLTILNEK